MTDAVRELCEVAKAAMRHLPREAWLRTRLAYRAVEDALDKQYAPEVCRWKFDEDSGLYTVGCYPGIIRNVDNFTYCPDCGGKIEVCYE